MNRRDYACKAISITTNTLTIVTSRVSVIIRVNFYKHALNVCLYVKLNVILVNVFSVVGITLQAQSRQIAVT